MMSPGPGCSPSTSPAFQRLSRMRAGIRPLVRKGISRAHQGSPLSWLTTYTDVMMLLITFFVLFITFATAEPEQFQQLRRFVTTSRMDTSSGVPSGSKDTIQNRVVRFRPIAARLTERGSEFPSLAMEIDRESVGPGLQTLTDSDERDVADRVSLESPLQVFQGEDGRPTPFARQQMRMLAVQIRDQAMDVELQVDSEEGLGVCVEMARHAISDLQVPPGRISVSVASLPHKHPNSLRIMMTRNVFRK